VTCWNENLARVEWKNGLFDHRILGLEGTPPRSCVVGEAGKPFREGGFGSGGCVMGCLLGLDFESLVRRKRPSVFKGCDCGGRATEIWRRLTARNLLAAMSQDSTVMTLSKNSELSISERDDSFGAVR